MDNLHGVVVGVDNLHNVVARETTPTRPHLNTIGLLWYQKHDKCSPDVIKGKRKDGLIHRSYMQSFGCKIFTANPILFIY